MGSRTWIKIYCDKWLNGTIREETPEVRGIWIDLLALAGSGKYGDSGEIKITDHVGFLDEQLADLLQISRQKWATIKNKLIETDRVIIKNANIIAIKNWSKYQSEYTRQKVYRQPQVTNNITPENGNTKLQPEVTTESTAGDRDKRIEKESREGDRDSSSLSPSKNDNEYVYKAYGENIGSVSEAIKSNIDAVINEHGASPVVAAIKEAVLRNQPKWIYVKGILRNWKEDGKLTPTDGQ